ncbi:MAG: NADH-quinone oxidoreductase subunit J [Anaerolineae bacterium]|nr:MAG: NADH-quinone oxidoreductase subunit J [Anaerolineae bacterium]
MTVEQIIFLIMAVVTLGSALMVVTERKMVRAALWLIVTLFGVAVFYALLNAGFFAVVQVVVYIGAIAVLFIFAAMLTRKAMEDTGPQVNAGWRAAALIGVVVFAALSWMLSHWSAFAALPPAFADDTPTLSQLGVALVSPDAYVIPFEIASVLLVAAMVGALYAAWGKKQ